MLRSPNKPTKKFTEHTYDDIGRIYNFDDGSQYYSVTTMLSNTKDTRTLDEWRKRVGHKKAEAISNKATEIGNQMHECLEQYLLKKPVEYPSRFVESLAKQIIPYLDRRVAKVHATEQVLYSDTLGLAGTVDGIVDYNVGGNSVFSVLDFKSAKRQPRMEWIKDYFLQMCAYSIMYEEIYNRKAEFGVLLFAYKESNSRYKEIIIDVTKYRSHLLDRIAMFNDKVGRK